MYLSCQHAAMMTMKRNKGEQVFKSIADYPDSTDFVTGMVDKYKGDLNKLKDPIVIGILLSQLKDQKEDSNRLLQTILGKLDSLESRIQSLEKGHSPVRHDNTDVILSDIDDKIHSFVKLRGRVCAKDVQKAFEYKGRNAASARLNNLYSMGVLLKKQVGRKVYFTPL